MDQLRRPLRPGLSSPPRGGGVFRGASARLSLILAATLIAACGAPSKDEWQNSFGSPRELAHAVLGSVEAGDTASLARYALTEHELRTTVWPALPASRPEVGMPWEYFWREHAQKNAANIQMLVHEHRGRQYDLVAVSFAGRDPYGGVALHRETALALSTPAGPQRLRLFGSMVERNGRWKLYSFVVD